MAVHDLRSALEVLAKHPGQLHTTNHPIDPMGELAGVYKRVGAGATVQRPTKLGPAMMFENVKGYPGARILVGLLASRQRVGMLLDCPPRELTQKFAQAVRNPLEPVFVDASQAPCQEVVHKADDAGFDIRTLLPAPTNTDMDAGPYFCEAMVLGSDPDNGHTDVTIHRLCVQSEDEISIFFAPGRHIDAFRKKAEAKGEALPVSINIGVDPAAYMGTSFEAPTTPLGFDELTIGGALRGEGVHLVECLTINQKALARAEIVIEGEILPNVRVAEDQNTNTGHAMPEFPGYDGPANPSLPVIKVKAVTTRTNPIVQTLVGPGEEHVSLAGIPTEAAVFKICEDEFPGFVRQTYAHSSGGGKFLQIIQVEKTSEFDDGRARQAGVLALGVYSELKHVVLVDEDVDPFDSEDVLWAMTTRFQADRDLVILPGIAGHVLDPSQTPQYNPALPDKGVTAKMVYDATRPYHLKDMFTRAQFRDVDPTPWYPGYQE
ncbi:UbiD family decarboxylase [Streptomyces cylindrosporus]|uniref:UbiD family decarboxylase n=1 Tax=Streptomyces cylindrosporus TaxID=2927583 RepID=A0ABS9Y094_9ACTN|nr:UbiD family decarboxylase [Streptomyces cylindrosporus]MCI3270647.1 UbiD family decarboxylase [Streptomyces cylindrosporus]